MTSAIRKLGVHETQAQVSMSSHKHKHNLAASDRHNQQIPLFYLSLDITIFTRFLNVFMSRPQNAGQNHKGKVVPVLN